mgnify:CR=1 FL=1
MLVRFCAVCFRHARSAFLRSAVCDLCFRGLCSRDTHFWRRLLSFRCYVSDGKTSSRSFFKSVISFRNWVKCPRQKQKQAWNKKPSLAERSLLTAWKEAAYNIKTAKTNQERRIFRLDWHVVSNGRVTAPLKSVPNFSWPCRRFRL